MADTYIAKNRGRITPSKIKCFLKCKHAYYLKYIKEVPVVEERSKPLVLGSALDYLLTYGADSFAEHYITVPTLVTERHVAEAQAKVDDYTARLEMALADGKTGKRETTSLNNWAAKLAERQAVLQRPQLTAGEAEKVHAMASAMIANPLFYHDDESFIQRVDIKAGCAVGDYTISLGGEIDRISHKRKEIRDYKALASADPQKVFFKIMDYQYLLSMRLYQRAVHAKMGVDEDDPAQRYNCILDIVGKEGQPKTDCVVLPFEALKEQDSIIDQAIMQMVKCKETGEWPNTVEQRGGNQGTNIDCPMYHCGCCQQVRYSVFSG